MVDVTPRVGADALIIQSYTPQGFRISGTDYGGTVLIVCGKVHLIEARSAAQLEYRHFLVLKGLDISYLVMGCGARAQMPSLDVLQELRHMDIVAEVMSTGAACRTYNVLLAEGRQVGALLVPG
ncbi:MAG: MTH938/NDUFAF3 family protein [Alphaproteobacteria bacterium]